ncbi:hypothetical protein C9374_012821 [Naegleria lovaniensis]|uniref:Solute-binding protein family 3/N-terminal domain-containing protein n=1 Tax=Naegleria lovaniensis TaxID=51637 RepID=A0AA88GCC7_NAELO|nr:uncharacterized protein C9374_012821 [Naegleria lovaniensis]KAG2373089.1 hypothetical protein C9374_012821 [Naegleria lovaniensis]
MSSPTLALASFTVCLLMALLFLSTPSQQQQFISVNKDFTAAFDAAIQELVVDNSWIQFYSDNMFFGVPQCATKVQWPAKDPFAQMGRTKIVTCFEIGTLTPWLETKTKLAESVVKIINNHYKTNYINEVKRYNTSLLGFFDTMKNAVGTGDCDIVTANTQPNADRAKVVHFQCGFGFASKGWIRSGKDAHISIPDVYSLNKTGILVGAYDGTAYATFVKQTLTAATYVPFYAVNLQYGAVLNQTVHALIGDAIQFFSWKKQVGNCNCEVKAYDPAYGLSTFTYGNITETSFATSSIRFGTQSWMSMAVVMMMVLFMIQTLFMF